MCSGMGEPRHLAPGLRPRPIEHAPTTPVRARKRPVEVDAIYWTGGGPIGNTGEVMTFCGTRHDGEEELLNFVPLGSPGPKLWVAADSAFHPITPGTWILRDTLGLYPCDQVTFAETYEVL